MGGWMCGWTDGWTDGWMDGWMGGQADRWIHIWMDRWMDGWIDWWIDEWMDGWMDGQDQRKMDGWKDNVKDWKEGFLLCFISLLVLGQFELALNWLSLLLCLSSVDLVLLCLCVFCISSVLLWNNNNGSTFPYPCLSVAIQSFNALAFHGTFGTDIIED